MSLFIVIQQNLQLDGNVNENVLPLPNSLSTQILPPCFSTNFWQINKPKPVPFSLAVPGDVYSCVASNSFDKISGAIPIPVSEIEIVTAELFCSVQIVIVPPLRVNLIAF